MTAERKHYETRHNTDYIGKLSEYAGECREVVFYKGEKIHDAEFPASNLGTSSRGGYLESMTASIAYKHRRNA